MKKSQLFKKKPDMKYVIDFIHSISQYDKMLHEYILDVYTFKKHFSAGDIQEFQTYITPFYYDAKYNYPLNMINYRGFVTVLRQICNLFDIEYRYSIKYIHSKYSIIYYFKLIF